MDVTQLLEPVLTHGLRTTHFFNGRVLTAEDLRTEQAANRAQHRQLARALGAGVVNGLEVTAVAPVEGVPALRIRAGLAFTRDGDAVALGRDVNLLLVNRQTPVPPEAGLFAVCMAPNDPVELTNVGLYVLTARPASAYSPERAPMTELGSEGVAGGCGSRWAVEGVRFAVTPLPLAAAGSVPSPLAVYLGDLAAEVDADVELARREDGSATAAVLARLANGLSRLRNGAAYLCFGADQYTAQSAAPLPGAAAVGFPDEARGALDAMRERQELGDCEVPLALFHVSRRGVEWVDAWAVRRPLVPALTAGALPILPSARALADALAMMLQFQQQVRDLTSSTVPTSQLLQLAATQRFRFLPPVGLLPVREGSTGRGFHRATFFAGIAFGAPAALSVAKLRRLVSAGLLHPPVDLDAQPASVELWRVPESAAGSAPWLLFITRETAGPAWRDTVALTLDAAWKAWRGVIRRRLFLPPGTDAEKVAAQVSMVNAVRDVMDVATHGSGRAAAGALDDRDAVDAYRRLYDVQNDVQQLFRSSIPGITQTQGREDFGSGLNVRLNSALPGGGVALLPALDAGSLIDVVTAQTNINQYVAGWSGEGVAMGPLLVDYMGNTRGVNVVPGDAQGFPQHFRVRNSADGTLTVTLEAGITGAAGDWSNAITVTDAAGAALTTFDMPTGAAVDAVVTVTAPAAGTVLGETPLLRLRATVPAPNARDVSATQQLSVAAAPGQAQLGSLTVLPPTAGSMPFPDPDNAPPQTVATFPLHLRYAGPEQLPDTEEVTVTLTIDAADPSLWNADLGDLVLLDSDVDEGVYTAAMTLTRGQQHALDVRVLTPARGTADRTASLQLSVESTELEAPLQGQLDTPLTLRVRAT